MQDDSLPSVFSLSLTYKVILQEVNLSPGDKALLWLPSGLQHFLPLAAGSWGKFYFLGLHGFNSLIAIEMRMFVPARRARKTPHSLP